ncbi:MAG: helix-turn-helix transcriptional regulator [Alphaproteobacteria bacterium]|nr:helix-turn-helix transcriptional regulator [Alphaproteobacteria bacterium]
MNAINMSSSVKSIDSDKDVMLYLAERIKIIRQTKNITLGNMASKIGITRKQLQNYENGQTNIGITRLWQIAQILQVDIVTLVEGLDNKPSSIDNESLEFIRLFNNLKDQNIKDIILGLLKSM